MRLVSLLLMVPCGALITQQAPVRARFGLRPEVLGCYALYDSSGARLGSAYYNSAPLVRLDSTAVRLNKKEGPHPIRYFVRLDTLGRVMKGGGEARFWWADSLTDSIRLSFVAPMSGAFAVLLASVGADTLRGHIENHWDVGSSTTDAAPLHAIRVPCRAA